MSGAPAPKNKSPFGLFSSLGRAVRTLLPAPVLPITAPTPAPLPGLPPVLAHLASTVGTGAAPQSEPAWRTETARLNAAQGAAQPGSFYGAGSGGNHAAGAYGGGNDRQTGFGGSYRVRCGAKGVGTRCSSVSSEPLCRCASSGADARVTPVQTHTYGATPSQPAAKRPRLDDAAARRQPDPHGAPAPSALTNSEVWVRPGDVDEVVVESSEAWIGASWTDQLSECSLSTCR